MDTRRLLVAVLSAIFVPWNEAMADDVKLNKDQCNDQVSYLSDSDSSYKYLEESQHEIYAKNPGLTDAYSRQELDSPRSVATFAELKKRAQKACPPGADSATCALNPDLVDKMMKALPCLKLPTRFESPLFYSLIKLYIGGLDRIRLAHFPDSSETRFGSLPTGTIDAQAILPPGSEVPVVILNRDLFFFTGALSKSISDAIPITEGQTVALDYSEKGIRQRLHDNPYIVANFADAMSRLVRDGSSHGAQEVTLDDMHNHLHARLVGAMDQFLISHEEAHVILKHVSDRSVQFRVSGAHKNNSDPHLKLAPAARSDINEPTTSLKVELRTREQEYAADALGFRLLIWSEEASGDPVGEMISAAAPHMVFRILDAADAYGTEAGTWTFSDANHPNSADRIKALAPVFADLAKDHEPLKEVDFRVPFDAVLKVLLAEADPQIRKNLGLPSK